VDTQDRAVCLTTHKEHAELKRDQIHAYGRDPRMDVSNGSMSAVIEPADFGGEDEDSA
jgi:ATP-dependent Clp protease adaptor protein ClpS